jgi:catechol 2,3-dioxygenase-like lactoylglutathione lyase family enzyme
MTIVGIDHVQLAIPRGGEQRGRQFYGELLGLEERPKPPELARRGGAWFERGDVKVHLGVDPAFTPATKAHPAFLVTGLPELIARLHAAGYVTQEEAPLPGYDRVFVEDPFGNRVELLERQR